MEGAITLEDARRTNCCRICGKLVPLGPAPVGWKDEFGVMTKPIRLTLHFGAEFAHTDCLGRGDGAAADPAPPGECP